MKNQTFIQSQSITRKEGGSESGKPKSDDHPVPAGNDEGNAEKHEPSAADSDDELNPDGDGDLSAGEKRIPGYKYKLIWDQDELDEINRDCKSF